MDTFYALFILLVELAIFAFYIACYWIVFTKANKPGWAALIPIYNLYVLTQIVGRPWWMLLLLLIPFVNIVVGVVLCLDLAKSFGKSTLFGVGIALLGFICIPILAFGSASYQGPSAGKV